MNLNQIRIIEACHKFLIGITNFEEELQDDVLVYRYKGNLVSFETYQEYEQRSFVDYNLKYGYLDDTRTYLDDRADLIAAFPSEEHLRALQRLNKLVCKSLSYYLRSILTLSPKKIPTSKKIILDMISSILQLKKNTLFIFFQMMNHLS
ncbi:TPA: hypothetical protein ACIN0M_000015 [Streptococcus agalactiae]